MSSGCIRRSPDGLLRNHIAEVAYRPSGLAALPCLPCRFAALPCPPCEPEVCCKAVHTIWRASGCIRRSPDGRLRNHIAGVAYRPLGLAALPCPPCGPEVCCKAVHKSPDSLGASDGLQTVVPDRLGASDGLQTFS